MSGNIFAAALIVLGFVMLWRSCMILRAHKHDAAIRRRIAELREDSLRDLTNDPRLLDAFKIPHHDEDIAR